MTDWIIVFKNGDTKLECADDLYDVVVDLEEDEMASVVSIVKRS